MEKLDELPDSLKWIASFCLIICLGCTFFSRNIISIVFSLFQNDFTVTYSGELEGKFKGDGFFTCVGSDSIPAYLEISLSESNSGEHRIGIVMPPDATVGKHSLGDTSPYKVSADIGLNFEDKIISGDLILEELPNDAWQTIKGSFHLDYENVVVKGTFDFISDPDGYYDCIP
jgi:hypothetical protein